MRKPIPGLNLGKAEDFKKASGFFIDGDEQNGTFIKYHLTGKMALKAKYKNGEYDGEFTRWDTRGRLEEEFKYKNGNLHGICTEYRTGGKRYLISRYVDGVKHGAQEKFYCTRFHYGMKERLDTFEHGILHGDRKGWDHDGLLLIDEVYQNGIMIINRGIAK